MNRLNLGCGLFPKTGYVNVDIDPDGAADLCHDLNIFPWPFADGEFDLVECDHLLAYLDDITATMKELHRILKPGSGRLIIRVPHCSRGFTDWHNRRGFDVSFPLYFNSRFPGGYAGVEFRTVSMRLTWFAQKSLKKAALSPGLYSAGCLLGAFFDCIGNINLFFTSRLLCYYVGGYDEIEYVLERPC